MRLAVPGIQEIYERIQEEQEFYDRIADQIVARHNREPLLPEIESATTFSLVTDIHCNVGMARTAHRVAEELKIALELNSGDTTFAGTEQEGPCTNNGGDIAILGNHDGEATRHQLDSSGTEVLDGAVIESMGIRILGDDDPRRSMFGRPIYYRYSENLAELGERLKETACSDPEGVDVLMVHDERSGIPALKAGCVTTVVAGHTHERRVQTFKTTRTGATRISIVGGTTGGAVHDKPTLGPLEGEATITIGQFDKETGAMRNYRFIVISPDGAVSFRPLISVNNQE